MFRLVITPIFILCFQVSSHAQSVHEKLTDELEIISNRNSIKGFGVAIFSKDTLLYTRGFGVVSDNKDEKYTTRTRQKIASVSKLLLGVSLLKAQELGLLQIDDKINDYLPFAIVNPYFPYEDITIRHLATHTSGLAKTPKYDLKALYAPTKIPKIKREMPFGIRRLFFNRAIKTINSNKEYHLEDFLINLYSPNGKWYGKKHFRKVKPGDMTEYSNSGASLLALVIQKASGISYAAFVRKYIIEPLQLESSKFDFELSHAVNEPTHYYHAGINIPNNYKLLLYPAGGFESTVEGFSILMNTVINGYSILSKESVKEMLTPQFKTEYGILWEVYPSGFVGHSGDMLGVKTFAYYNINKNIGYLLFCNTAGTKTIEKETEEIKNVLKSYFNKFATTHE